MPDTHIFQRDITIISRRGLEIKAFDSLQYASSGSVRYFIGFAYLLR